MIDVKSRIRKAVLPGVKVFNRRQHRNVGLYGEISGAIRIVQFPIGLRVVQTVLDHHVDILLVGKRNHCDGSSHVTKVSH